MALFESFALGDTTEKENALPAWILDGRGFCYIAENADSVPIPGHIPNTGDPSGTATSSTELIVQRDQPLFVQFRWQQSGLFTNFPMPQAEWTMTILFELLGQGEVGFANPVASVPFQPNAGFGNNRVYDHVMSSAVFTPPLQLDGIYRVYARFGFGWQGVPHTPISVMLDMGMLNVYHM